MEGAAGGREPPQLSWRSKVRPRRVRKVIEQVETVAGAIETAVEGQGDALEKIHQDKSAGNALEGLYSSLHPGLLFTSSQLARAFLLFPVAALHPGRMRLLEVAGACRSPRDERFAAGAPERGNASLREYGQTLRRNAEALVRTPDVLDDETRRILTARIDGLPADLDDVDGPHLTFVATLIRNRIENPLQGRALWRFVMEMMVVMITVLTIVYGLSRQTTYLALAAVVLALLGGCITGFIQASLLDGYDYLVIAEAKTQAKVPSAFAVLAGIATTLTVRGHPGIADVVLVVGATGMIAMSALVADRLVNHAEAAMKECDRTGGERRDLAGKAVPTPH